MTDPTRLDPTRMATALEFHRVAKRFETGTEALSEVDLSVAAGEFLGVVGPSGCGKSTLLRLAAGLERPSGGRVKARSDRLAFVFQDPTLLPWRTALANVELVAELHGLPRSRRREQANRALDTVGLADFADQLPAHLSGGMRMRVSLARALVLAPDLFLFDEPFGALDEITRLRLQEEVQRLVHAGGFSALLVTHSVSEAVYMSHRVVVLSARPGRIVAEIDVPFEHPRPARLRFDAEFGRLAATVSDALAGEHT